MKLFDIMDDIGYGAEDEVDILGDRPNGSKNYCSGSGGEKELVQQLLCECSVL